jgi:hypothetical protein
MMAGLLFSVYEIRTKGDGSSAFFLVATWQIVQGSFSLKILKKSSYFEEKKSHVAIFRQ